MADLVIGFDDLASYLNDPDIEPGRAEGAITDAQILCESVVSPLPDGADVVVKRVAGRAYTSVMSPRQQQLANAGSPYAAGSPVGGAYLTQFDIEDLRRLGGGGGAFSINLLPASYTAPVSWSSPMHPEGF